MFLEETNFYYYYYYYYYYYCYYKSLYSTFRDKLKEVKAPKFITLSVHFLIIPLHITFVCIIVYGLFPAVVPVMSEISFNTHYYFMFYVFVLCFPHPHPHPTSLFSSASTALVCDYLTI